MVLTTKFPEENTGNELLDTSLGDDFLNLTSTKSKGNKSKNKQVGLYQLESFCTAKEIINKMKRQPTEWKEIIENNILSKDLISKMLFKKLIQFNRKKIANNPVKKFFN